MAEPAAGTGMLDLPLIKKIVPKRTDLLPFRTIANQISVDGLPMVLAHSPTESREPIEDCGIGKLSPSPVDFAASIIAKAPRYE